MSVGRSVAAEESSDPLIITEDAAKIESKSTSRVLVIWKKKQKRIVVTVLKDRLGKTLTPKVSQLEMYGVFGPNG